MAILDRIANAVGFKYDALEPRGKRRSVPRSVPMEDSFIRGSKRKGLQSNAADLARNLSVAAWMVRRHMDYVAAFAFHGRNDDDTLNTAIEKLMVEDSRPNRADVAGRFGREKLFRIAEMRRVLDGDTALVKYRNGRLQGIQADLIADPDGMIPDDQLWINGIRVNGVGRPMAFGVHKRTGFTGTEYLRALPARNVIHYGFFERFAGDQVRGVSPIVSALNPLRDVYENFDYALAKAKVAHIFALSIYQQAGTQPADDDEDGLTAEELEAKEPYDVDLSRPNVITMDAGDRAEVLESRQPSSEFQDFTKLVIQVALKALDLPFSFFDESHTNFFGSRAAWMHYERACVDRRNDQIEMRRQYTVWKLRQWITGGRLELPGSMTIADLDWEWVPRGMPWWDGPKEIRGNVLAIAAGLDTPQRICRATDSDYYENIKQRAKAEQFARDHGVDVSFTPNLDDQVEPPSVNAET